MSARLLFRRGRGLRHALIGAEDDVGADGRGVIVGEILVKGNHAGLFELALQNYFKPLIVVERGRVAQIGEDASTDGDVAMARRAEPLKEGFTLFYRGDAGGGLWWLELRRSELRKRGKASFAV